MTVQQRSRAHRQLETYLRPRVKGTQVGSAERFRYDVREKDRAGLLHYGKAAAIHGDAAPNLQLAGDPSVVDADAARIRHDHLGDGTNYPCEHLCTP